MRKEGVRESMREGKTERGREKEGEREGERESRPSGRGGGGKVTADDAARSPAERLLKVSGKALGGPLKVSSRRPLVSATADDRVQYCRVTGRDPCMSAQGTRLSFC